MKIYNLGSLNIDYVYSVDHFVGAKETLASQKLELFPGGKGLNQSVALARAGGKVLHGAAVGADGAFLLGVLADSGVDVSRIKTLEGSSGHAIIQVDPDGQNCILLYAGSNACIDDNYVSDFLCDAEEGDVLLLQNETSGIEKAMVLAHQKGMKIAFNPSPFDAKIGKLPLEYVNWFFCNEVEAEALFGCGEVEEILSAFEKRFPQGELVLTLGAEGSVYYAKGKSYEFPIVPAEVIDTTAAGDTFTGYFISCICRGMSAVEAMEKATKASSITVSRKGASVSIPYYHELKD